MVILPPSDQATQMANLMVNFRAKLPPTNDDTHDLNEYTTFNHDFAKQKRCLSTSNNNFPLFSRLPLELRLKVWTAYLQQYRFLRIDIVSTEAETRTSRFSPDYTDDSNVIHDQEYCIYIRNPPRPCILSTVCQEAARVSRQFYRVRIPCYLNRPRDQPRRKGFMLLHPEWDIVDVHTNYDSSFRASNIIYFLQDLKTLDPSHIGVLNLSLDGRQAEALAELNILSHRLPSGALDSFRDTIANLHRLFWRVTPTSGRVLPGYLLHLRAYPWYNISMPLMANSSCIEFIRPDPRIIQQDLNQVWLGHDPRTIPGYWSRVEETLKVRAGQATKGEAFQCQLLVAQETWEEAYDLYPLRCINDHASVTDFLRGERKDWDGIFNHFPETVKFLKDFWYKGQAKYTPDLDPISPSDVISRLGNTAVGFWLFDLTALPDPKDDRFTGANVEGKTVVGLVGKQPELCLFDIGL